MRSRHHLPRTINEFSLIGLALLSLDCGPSQQDPPTLSSTSAVEALPPPRSSPTPSSSVNTQVPTQAPRTEQPIPALEDELAAVWEPHSYAQDPGSPRLRIGEDTRGGPCGFAVTGEAFPAVDREAKLVVNLEYEGAQGPSDYDESKVVLVWRNFDDAVQRRIELYDNAKLGSAEDDSLACDRTERALEGQLPELQAMLDGQALVPMRELPLQLHAFDLPSPPLSPRGDERPVEMLYNAGQLIVRVQGLEVLSRQDRPRWAGPRDSMDARVPNILAVYGDRPSEIAVVLRDYQNASCMSDTQRYAGVARLSEAVFAEIELRGRYALRAIR